MRQQGILVCGTMQKRHTTPLVYFGTSKHPRPTNAFPKGCLKMAKKTGENVYCYAWMDSAGVYFIDPVAGPGVVQSITRRNAIGTPIEYRVPAMIAMYNQYMHGVDVFDQVRKMFGCDLTHATKKYTVRVFEILFSMILGQAYNIHRYIHKDTIKSVSHTQFKGSVLKGFLNSYVVSPMLNADDFSTHSLVQYPPGSATGNDNSNRRKQVACRACSNLNADGSRNTNRRTSFYCQECKVGFHPACFTILHSVSSTSRMTPAKRLRDTTGGNSSRSSSGSSSGST